MKYNTLVILIALLILSTIFGRLVTRYFSGLRELDATANSKEVAKMISDNINNYHFKNTTLEENRREIYKITEDTDYNITIMDKSGTEIINSKVSQSNINLELGKDEIKRVLSGNRVIKKIIGNEINHMLIAFPLTHNNNNNIKIVENQNNQKEIMGAIILQTPLENMTDTINKLMKMVVIAALITLIIAFIINITFSKRVTKPLRKIENAAINVSDGNYKKVDIPENSTDEIIKVIQTFNYAIDQIESNFEEKRKLEKMRKEFVADISHEFRAPLTSIKGFLELFIEEDLNEKEIKKYAKIMYSDTNYLEHLVKDLLTLGRLDSENTPLKLEKIDLEKIINQTINSLKTKFHKKNIKIIKRIPDRLPFIRAEKMSIKRVIINLLENAITYSPENSNIIVKVSIILDELKISIIDEGPGIPEDKLENIWNRFYKIDKARTRKEKKGSGLGLSIVKNIIKQHGGRVEAKNKKNKGAEFSFYLKINNS